jgi:hypothetical protein
MKTLLIQKLLLSVLVLFIIQLNFGQGITQNIKGIVIDKESKEPLPGATVYLADMNPFKGTTTDEKGNFKLEDIETGRHRLCISYVAYSPVCYENLNLTSGKELVINVEMESSITGLKEVVVKAQKDKSNAVNTMSTISSRTFSIEETQRYAGARNDVARMAINYAGVSAGNDATNEIIIRGNSPNGLLWQLEGVEIPNPNHFGSMGATGGPVSMLNNNTLDNSDFITGAFAAEYGNAVSGVFDLHLREGNHDKHEFLGEIGFNGFELGAEGPLSKKNNASYLFSYRYSTLAFSHLIGIDFGTGTAIPEYQDLSLKVVSSLWKGKITLFGLGGISAIDFKNSDKDTSELQNLYTTQNYDLYNSNKQGVIGVSYFHNLGSKTYAEIKISADGLQNKSKIDTIYRMPTYTTLYDLSNLHNEDYAANLIINSKINNMLNVRIGAEIRKMDFSLKDSSYQSKYHSFFNVYDDHGSTYLYRGFIESMTRLTEQLSVNAGLHVISLALNNEISFEPRLAIKYKPFHNQSFSVGYGNHSKILPMYVYYRRVEVDENDYLQPNTKLNMLKANHFIASWDWQVSSLTRIKLEGYYQHLYNAVIGSNPSSFSLLNNSSYQFNIVDTLKNGGTGDNKGIELTIEQFISKGFYYLITTSIYDSKYKGSDGITHPTVFDGGYVINLLGGKEFKIHSRKLTKKRYITSDLKLTAAGGQRYTPVNIEESKAKNETVYDESKAFSEKFRDYFRMDIRVGFRIDHMKYSHEFAFDIQNLTNRTNPLYMFYNTETGKMETINQLKITPMVQYRINF